MTAPATSSGEGSNWMDRVVSLFLSSNYSVLLVVISLVAGAVALQVTPREEDPQIVVPVANLIVRMPGATAAEVERQVATRAEKLIYQIEGIEDVYSVSQPGVAVITARFFVGVDREEAWVRLQDKIDANVDQLPPGVAGWVVKPLEIDDVPIVTITLYGEDVAVDDHALRRMAEELVIRLQAVPDAGRTAVVGGRPRVVNLTLSPARMAARGIGLHQIQRTLAGAGVRQPAGGLVSLDRVAKIQAGAFLTSADEVGDLVVASHGGRPVYLREVADVALGPDEAVDHVRFALGQSAFEPGDPGVELAAAGRLEAGRDVPAVTVAVAKRRGANAVWVSEAVQEAAAEFARQALPPEVHLRVTRDYGLSADHKVGELIEALWVAVAIVVALLAYSLGLREGLIIALAVPITFSITLLVNLLLGYSINRVTLFALILALGLVVDDPIVDVENVHRHLERRPKSRFRAVLQAVNEVRPPIILATLAVIVSFVPLFFITGMMGPYMAPMALNVPVSMLASLAVAFTVTPWLCLHLLHVGEDEEGPAPPPLEETPLYRAYAALLGPLLTQRRARAALFGTVGALFALCGWLMLTGRVPLKMLPYDNKNELQVLVDMPEGTSLERTEAVTAEVARLLARLPESTDVTWYTGIASPIDFNGLVRQYSLRREPHLGDVRLNLVTKKRRAQQSHAIGLRLRPLLEPIAARNGAVFRIVEVPPGPPVLATLVAEVYGGPTHDHAALLAAAERVRAKFGEVPGVVDIDVAAVAPQEEVEFRLDRAKAALHGVSEADAAGYVAAAFGGAAVGALRLPDEVQPTRVVARLPRAERLGPLDLERLFLPVGGAMIPIAEIGRVERGSIEQPRYRKNLRRVVYVTAETAGTTPAEAVLSLSAAVDGDSALAPFEVEWSGEGEWKITLDAFRDLGIAFGVAVFGIYVLLVYQTESYLLPLVLLVAIPLTIIGIVPGFWLLNLVAADTVGGFSDPVYFTATGMIGMIALAGIATRNAILLVEFIQEARARGAPLNVALIEAGALRTRPIVLTAGTALLAAAPITLDPIFSGLAWALIFGLLVSTAFTLLVVPTIYGLAYGGGEEPAPALGGAEVGDPEA